MNYIRLLIRIYSCNNYFLMIFFLLKYGELIKTKCLLNHKILLILLFLWRTVNVCKITLSETKGVKCIEILSCSHRTFGENHSDSTKMFSETDIINMLEFLIDNIFVIFGWRVFQQTVGIPMGANCAPSSRRLVPLFV